MRFIKRPQQLLGLIQLTLRQQDLGVKQLSLAFQSLAVRQFFNRRNSLRSLLETALLEALQAGDTYACACMIKHHGGQMYAVANISGGSDRLIKVDKLTGAVTNGTF